MLELTGIAGVLRGIGVLYWLLAAGVIVYALWKGKDRRSKITRVLIAVAVFGFLPAVEMIGQMRRDAYAREAWAYFKKKCETEAGEKIYKTFTGVKSVLVVKPLPPATEKDLYDQFWYGDPYSASAHGHRGEFESALLASSNAPVAYDQLGRGFDFVESVISDNKGGIVKYYYLNGRHGHLSEIVHGSISRFGISWEDISTPEDRKYWVAGSRLRVIDLRDSSIVAERIGYFIEAGFGSKAGGRRPWLTSRGPRTTCPSIRNGNFEDRWFILKVLKPVEEKENGR